MCRIELQKAVKCVHFTINLCEEVLLIYTEFEHTSVTLPVNETLNYDYHQDKGTDRIWNCRHAVCRIESQKAMKCVLFTVTLNLLFTQQRIEECALPTIVLTKNTNKDRLVFYHFLHGLHQFLAKLLFPISEYIFIC